MNLWVNLCICQQEWIWLTSQKYKKYKEEICQTAYQKPAHIKTPSGTIICDLIIPDTGKGEIERTWYYICKYKYRDTQTMFPTRTSNISSESALSAPSWYFFLQTQFFTSCTLSPSRFTLQSSHRILPPTCLLHLPVLPFPSQNLCARPWQWQVTATGHYPKFQWPMSCCHHPQHHQVYISPRMSWDIR